MVQKTTPKSHLDTAMALLFCYGFPNLSSYLLDHLVLDLSSYFVSYLFLYLISSVYNNRVQCAEIVQ